MVKPMQQPTWQTRHIATRIYRLSRVDSTQAMAARMVVEGAFGGALIVAVEQTSGRGRLARTWHSPVGNLYLSLILKPPMPLSAWPQASLWAALALAETLDSYGFQGVALKWPNDVLLGGKKVAGVLAEIIADSLILGVGINVNAELPSELEGATTLRSENGGNLDLEAILRAFVETFDALLDRWLRGETLTERWAARLETLGREVQVRLGERVVDGVAERVTGDGALVVRTEGGRHEVCYAGDASLRSSA
jgi:BirA family biotin operon repressor/biotin-[acetyl-CoA-carboxylase] ligase